jgi:diguanylate cyclase (GGDEF)-like protein
MKRLLDSYAAQLNDDSTLRIQVRLLQARLEPPLSLADLEVLQDYVELYASQIESLPKADAGLLQQAVDPLLEAFGIATDSGVSHQEVSHQGVPAAQPVLMQGVPAIDKTVKTAAVAERSKEDESKTACSVGTVETLASVPVAADQDHPFPGQRSPGGDQDTANRAPKAAENAQQDEKSSSGTPIDSGKRNILELQSELASQILDTISQNEEFGVLLEVVLGELRRSAKGRELEDLRWTLIREIEKLTKGHHELAEKLDNTHHYLRLVESDSRQLSDELSRVRLLSLTDELTGLPNRRAFLRRIEDEVARVQRYGFPLSLALIDLDHFKQVNDRYGHSGGDEVLKIYSKNILSIFRHHDLVARYGGEEFAVLLPNTQEEGSMRALNKVKARAEETRWQFNDEMIAVPTFSSGVSLYKPGETASAFIERADKALYRAKRLGRNRVELDATYRSSSTNQAAKPAVDS